MWDVRSYLGLEVAVKVGSHAHRECLEVTEVRVVAALHDVCVVVVEVKELVHAVG